MKKRYLNIKHRESTVGREATHNCLVYLTPVAGVCIHTRYQWNTKDDIFTRCHNSWNITQYPTGLKIFDNIYSKEEALDIVMRYMTGFNWVGLTDKEILASNNETELLEMAGKVRRHIDAANKLLKD